MKRLIVARWRMILAVMVATALAPVTWIRTELPAPDFDAPVTFTRIATPIRTVGEVEILRAWKLASNSNHFGGYSAMIATGPQQLIAASDLGRIMRLSLPAAGSPIANLSYLSGKIELQKRLIDAESMTRDPGTGRIWIGYEGINAIERRDERMRNPRGVRPPQMGNFSSNKGAEAIARLADGRFIVLAEGSRGWGSRDFAGLLFPADPVDDPAQELRAAEFNFDPPEGYRPVDMVQIPDGRVLILVRTLHWQIMPRFTAKLVLADPAEIYPGGTWSGRVIAEFAPPNPSDNYEGLAMWPRPDGLLDLWLVSDDNRNSFQNTYLLEMRWNPAGGTAN
ncbi:MAG: esterase-like activity of phytase family protein [Allopontixanthobacter sediminis]